MDRRSLTVISVTIGVMVVITAAIAVFYGLGGSSMGGGTAGGGAARPDGRAATNTQPGSQPATYPPTRVMKGKEPEQWVKAYYQAVLAGEYEKAWAMQPASNKAQADAAAFEVQQRAYGLRSWRQGTATGMKDQLLIETIQDLGAQGTWYTYWVFEGKKGDWVVVSKRTERPADR